MVDNPTRGWDRIPIYGWFFDNPGVPAKGQIEFTMTQRIKRTDGRAIYAGGARKVVKIGDAEQQDPEIKAAVKLAYKALAQAEEGAAFDEAVWEQRWDAHLSAAVFTSFWAADDPDITPHGAGDDGYKVLVQERLSSGAGKQYHIQPLIAHLDQPLPGINLADVEVPPGAPAAPAPVYAKGQPGGVAALDADGDVVNARGVKVGPVTDEAAASLLAQDGEFKAALSTVVQDAVAEYAAPATAGAIGRHQTNLTMSSRQHGGTVGTDGKPIISFRIDHGIDQWLEHFWPLFRERGIPASVHPLTRAMENPTDPYEPTNTTWDTLLTEARKGFEVWAHSHTHEDPAVVGTTLHEEIVGCKEILESKGFLVQGYQSPGIPGVTTPHYANNFTEESWATPSGQLILANYALASVRERGGALYWPPLRDGGYHVGKYTLDGMTWPQVKSIIDTGVLRDGLSTTFMLHPYFIITRNEVWDLAQMVQLLDYVRELRDAGRIEVLTVSSAYHADPGQSRRLDLTRDGSFEQEAAFPGEEWQQAGGTGAGMEVRTDGGHSGTNYLHIPAGAGYSYAYQGYTTVQQLRLQGATMRVEAWVRCTEAATQARLTILDASPGRNVTLHEWWQQIPADGQWHHIQAPFTVPLDCTNVQIRISRRSGSGHIDFDDVRTVVT